MTDPSRNLPLLRRQRLERSGCFPAHTQEEALRLLDDIGFCRFSRHHACELPGFEDLLAEEVQGESWGWKDALPNTRRVYYGQVYRFELRDTIRPGFVALRMLAAWYALSPVFQFGGDKSMLPRWAGMSREALILAEALEREGSLSTKSLRRVTGLEGKEHETVFNKALIEAQRHFLIVRIGVTSTTRANYGYIWDSFEHAYPDISRQAEALDEQAAAATLLRQYVDTVVAIDSERVAFVLGLEEKLLRSAGERLVEEGVLTRVEGDGAVVYTTTSSFSGGGEASGDPGDG